MGKRFLGRATSELGHGREKKSRRKWGKKAKAKPPEGKGKGKK